jgi:hypothetical protein
MSPSLLPSHCPFRLGSLFLLFIVYPLSFVVSLATVPFPSCVFYGQARDEYGVPYLTNATVILRVAGREGARCTIDRMLAPGINFRLPLDLDDGRGTAYASYAARAGQPVQISVLAHGIERPIIETRALAVGGAGEFIGIYVTTGIDTDADGLPDEWEWELLENSLGAYSTIAEIRPEDDADLDGVSNWDEYRAGTLAFAPEDFLYIEETARVANGRLRLRFLSTAGITYQVRAADSLGSEAVWPTVPFALDGQTAAANGAVVGNGYYLSLYADIDGAHRFFRIDAR